LPLVPQAWYLFEQRPIHPQGEEPVKRASSFVLVAMLLAAPALADGADRAATAQKVAADVSAQRDAAQRPPSAPDAPAPKEPAKCPTVGCFSECGK
jgi:hypothetical protein